LSLAKPSRRSLASGLAALALIGGGQNPQFPVFRSESEMVAVYATVTSDDKRRAVVEGLTASDFLVADNGVPQVVEGVLLESLGVDVTVLIDVSGSIVGALRDSMRAELARLQGMMTPDDRVDVLYFDSRVSRIPPAGGLTTSSTWRPFGDGGTVLYDSVATALMQPIDPIRRKVVLVFTDGLDNRSILQRDTRRALVDRSSAIVYCLLFSHFGRTSEFEATFRGEVIGDSDYLLTELSADSGGEMFDVRPGASAADAVNRVLEMSRTRYTIRYTPRNVAREGWHELSVSVPGQRVRVTAKKGYWR
jgi:VWFA-related protein